MSDYLKAIQGVIDDLESGNLAGIEDAIAYFRRRLATIAAVENRRAASAAPAEGREPTGDELRKLTREIRDASGGPSDAPQPADYVLGGWRAALATAPTMSEAAKWDAARYRFLRKTAMRVQAKTNSHPHWLFGGFEMCGATFDDAIDAAIDRAAAKGESDERI
jgi:hypothetical protein